MESKALGKGLSALIPEKTELADSDAIKFVKISELRENILQPRQDFNDEKLADLIESIRDKGVLQPILVRKKDEGYEIIAGERRLRAARSLELEKIPVIIKEVSDQEALILALVENIQREELNAIEEANAFKKLIEDFNLTQEDVAQSVGKNRSTITNILRLLKLPTEIQEAIKADIFSVGHARALLGIEDEKERKRLFAQTLQKGLSVRELENLINTREGRISRRKKKISFHKDIYLSSIEEDLQRMLGTKVRIQAKQKRGKIIVEYYSNEDLERIISFIKK